MKEYKPSKKILEKYADVMVHYALNEGKGIKKNETVLLVGREQTKPLLFEIYKKIIDAGAHVVLEYLPDDSEYNFDEYFYNNANEKQISNFPAKLVRGKIDEINHYLRVLSESDMDILKNANSKNIMKKGDAWKPWMQWRNEKQATGKFSWTLCNYGTPAMAAAANLDIKEYWNQIIKACYLRDKNPVATWQDLQKQIQKNVKKLDTLCIDTLKIEGSDVDLEIKLSPFSAWKGGSGANIPSFEIFTSPDWRGTNGWIRFNQPLYRYGNVIENIYLEFKKGKVVKATATKGQKILREMIATKNADKIGEFSLTDMRFSKITKPMADTLYDENMGGKYGNTHIALGMSYRDCYKGDYTKLNESDWKKLGYNNSSVHTDIISTTDRTVTATLQNGTEKVIYQKGKFNL
ncbi:MAG: aminopeptidase [Candidatus Pacebacteria bacterium]|nr:aminopeptidase [Candidatus Paceibacterota bacterium]